MYLHKDFNNGAAIVQTNDEAMIGSGSACCRVVFEAQGFRHADGCKRDLRDGTTESSATRNVMR